MATLSPRELSRLCAVDRANRWALKRQQEADYNERLRNGTWFQGQYGERLGGY